MEATEALEIVNRRGLERKANDNPSSETEESTTGPTAPIEPNTPENKPVEVPNNISQIPQTERTATGTTAQTGQVPMQSPNIEVIQNSNPTINITDPNAVPEHIPQFPNSSSEEIPDQEEKAAA